MKIWQRKGKAKTVHKLHETAEWKEIRVSRFGAVVLIHNWLVKIFSEYTYCKLNVRKVVEKTISLKPFTPKSDFIDFTV